MHSTDDEAGVIATFGLLSLAFKILGEMCCLKVAELTSITHLFKILGEMCY